MGGRRGHRGERQCPSTNLCTINLRANFLLFKLSILDLVNIWGPAYSGRQAPDVLYVIRIVRDT